MMFAAAIEGAGDRCVPAKNLDVVGPTVRSADIKLLGTVDDIVWAGEPDSTDELAVPWPLSGKFVRGNRSSVKIAFLGIEISIFV